MGRRREFREAQHLDWAAIGPIHCVRGGATRRRRLCMALESDAAPWVGPEWAEPTRSGRGAHRAGDPPPHRQPGERRRQVQDDPLNRALDPHGELEQPFAQRRDLGIGHSGSRGPAPQFLEQDVGPPRVR
jgi:hypothetical protein